MCISRGQVVVAGGLSVLAAPTTRFPLAVARRPREAAGPAGRLRLRPCLVAGSRPVLGGVGAVGVVNPLDPPGGAGHGEEFTDGWAVGARRGFGEVAGHLQAVEVLAWVVPVVG